MNIYDPYKKGYLDVSDGHQLYYELCGNPQGKPVLFVHGGPGQGFTENDKHFFDPDTWNILLLDQRGAARSKPFASLLNNTTQKLVEDFTTFLHFIGIEKVFLFGGSCGATFALVYAIANPEKVTGMLLRGIYLATDDDKQHYVGGGVEKFFPDVWERFISQVPIREQDQADAYYLKQMQSNNATIKEKYTYEWAYYELSLLRLQTDQEQIKKDLIEYSYESLALLEAHYISNNFFLPNNFILDNTHKIENIPLTIVHGRYDFVCPPINAFMLHKKIKSSQLIFTLAGHASSEPETKKTLISEMKRFGKVV